jgi:hypothetical protein
MRCKILVLLLGLFLLVGCGGTGGPAVQRFTYVTQWAAVSGGVDGQSQLVQLFDLNNVLQFSTTLDKPTTSRIIFGVPNGTYHLHVELYSQPGQQGIVTGTLDDLITITNSVTYNTVVGPAVTSVTISPDSASFQVLHSQQFYATAHTAQNKPTFTPPNGLNWQTFGGVATVDQNGLVIGTSPGQGSVSATHIVANATGAATLTVLPNSSSHSKWTVIVFMNAANNLWPDSILNMNQMERVAQNNDVRFVVQWKQSTNVEPNSTFNSTRRYLVKPDLTNTITSEIIQDLGPGYDMGSASNMLDFITWAKTNYSADRYCVVIWNHGNGWHRRPGEGEVNIQGVSYDDETGQHIDTWQLAQALGNGVNDILAWDASLMQQLEVAAEVRDKAIYIIGSEESPPEQGYPYDTIFMHFRDNPDDTTLNLSKAFVDETLAYYGNINKITQSVIATSQLPALITATSSLSDALIANVGLLGTIAPQVRATAQKYSDNPVNGHYRDLYDVCLKFESLGAPAAVNTAGNAVKSAINSAVVYEGHNQNSPASHGVSIDFSSSLQFAPIAADYANLRFAQETTWDSWLGIAP